jgi:ABC-type Fe3+-siderophore transport system permease subunit
MLVGIAINALCGALVGVLAWLSNDAQLRQLSLWGMGPRQRTVACAAEDKNRHHHRQAADKRRQHRHILLAWLSNDAQLRQLSLWGMGSLGQAEWPTLLVAASLIIPASIAVWRMATRLNLLQLGDEEAHYLGVNVRAIQRLLLLCSAVLVWRGDGARQGIGNQQQNRARQQ